MPNPLAMGHRGRGGAGLTSASLRAIERASYIARFRNNDWYVNSNVAVSGGSGDSWDAAFSTLAAAISAAKAGDRIHVADGHAETYVAAVSIAKAGLQILGYGEGTRRPTFSLNHADAQFDIDAASVRLDNLLILSVITAVTIMVDVNATDVVIESCEFRHTTGVAAPTDTIDINGGAANACDRVKVLNCLVNHGTTTGPNQAIELGEVANGVEIRGCTIMGDFTNACIHNPTGKVLTDLTIADSFLKNVQTGDHSIELISACTGALIRNLYHNNMTQATGSDPGSCFSYECYHDDVIDTSAIVSPAVT